MQLLDGCEEEGTEETSKTQTISANGRVDPSLPKKESKKDNGNAWL
jgi:hypothetical protein